MMHLTILGATGSIGTSTVDVMRRHPERFSAFALVGHRNVDGMRTLVEQVRPQWVVMTDDRAARELRERLPAGIGVESGMRAAIAMAEAPEVDMVMAAMVGSVGLPAAMAAVRAGKRVGLANKECLVAAGRLFMQTAAESGAQVVPVDSEHAAVHQCLAGHDVGSIEKILITASGGPFRTRDLASMADVTPEEAVAHPNWHMGAKISVDSATMMNKALELIEARWLFDLPSDRLAAIIHPQSIVHALVQYVDGSVLAQMAEPDMRAPIAYALMARPRLASGTPMLDLAAHGALTFEDIDEQRFPAMAIARAVMSGEDSMAIAMNAANEVANLAFRQRRLPFTRIVAVVEQVLERCVAAPVASLDEVWLHDAEARKQAERLIATPHRRGG